MAKDYSFLKTVNDCATIILQRAEQITATLPASSTGITADQFIACAIKDANLLSAARVKDRGGDYRPFNTSSASAKATCLSSVLRCATMGLPPGDGYQFCFLIPRTLNNADVVQVYMGYPGYLELGYASGYLADCSPGYAIVGEDITRWHDDDGEHLSHKIPIGRPPLTPDNLLCAYCTYKNRYGGKGNVVIEKHDIIKLNKGDIWRMHFAAMVCKTAILRASKTWRRTQELTLAQRLDEQFDSEVSQIEKDVKADETIDLSSFQQEQ